ncbi:hypothetical protein [Thermococcus sp.]|uniref:hypothetical protein n=1 Tax=Thermococcus sp. TaxID=35749 RepID=UPI0026093D01|nr:hypothetical protein [Thermococcus sp.]
MAKIRPQTLVAGLAGKATPMNNIGAKGFYIQSVGARWWVKKSGAILANLPYTIESPHKGQVDVRVKFGEIAHETKGMPLAERLRVIRERMSGYKSPYAMNPEEYPSKKRGYHTLAQLKAMLGETEAKGRTYGGF